MLASHRDFWTHYVSAHLQLLGDFVSVTYADFCSITGQPYEPRLLVSLSGGLDSSTALVFAVHFADRQGFSREDVVALVCVRDGAYQSEERRPGSRTALGEGVRRTRL